MMSKPLPLNTANDEIARVRAEYARRAREIPADFYGWHKPANFFLQTQTSRACIAELAAIGMFPLDGKRVLDVGCGSGQWLLEFAQWGADRLAGLDLDAERLERTRLRLPMADLRAGDAQCLPWPDSSFDIVSQFVLFTSILDARVKARIAAEMMRVLAPGGCMVWYDFRVNNPRNPNVRGIRPREIYSLFPGCAVKLRSLTLAPPVARLVVPVSWGVGAILESVPFLRSHFLALIRRGE
jgi:SAM-dependent methyltransferase